VQLVPTEQFAPFLDRDDVKHLLEMLVSPSVDVCGNALTASVRACHSSEANAKLFAVSILAAKQRVACEDVWDVIATFVTKICSIYDTERRDESSNLHKDPLTAISWSALYLLHCLARHLQNTQPKDLVVLGGSSAIPTIAKKLREKIFPATIRLLSLVKCPISLLDHQRLAVNALTMLMNFKAFSTDMNLGFSLWTLGKSVFNKLAASNSARDPVLVACAQRITSLISGKR